MLAFEPLCPLVGVKVAVRVSPAPSTELKVPLTKLKSPAVPFQAKLAPGSSLNVNVMAAVWPASSVLLSLVMVTVGALVSTL